ncbi:hypothetical protein KY366_01800 [Candidatus Woesearchaeota archaeon]|nr:hypothetical protein [Candidatus Woesearchaeota archaeon]
MNLAGFKLDTKKTVILILLMIGIFSFLVLGKTGFKTIMGVLALFVVPSYLILNKTSLSTEEKIVFSFFLSIGFFPSIVYYLGLLIGVRKAIIVSFLVLLAAGMIINFKIPGPKKK